MINMRKSITYKMNEQVRLIFTLTQHSRDELLMKSLVSYFGCGRYALRSNKDYGDFLVTTLSDINEKTIPFFKKYEIKGVKAYDFADFCKAAEIMKTKGHLTPEGLNKLLALKDNMNQKKSL